MNRTFYATHLGSNEVRKYTGTCHGYLLPMFKSDQSCRLWKLPLPQHVATSTVINDQFISRLNANGTITKIFTDTTLRFTFSLDMEVDSVGNIYCFRGPAIGNTRTYQYKCFRCNYK
ncbi:MAG: hypothetical protein IPI23_16360 [Bacteroidetes bacterium]|nr:hypothetical protein [Bacteroidota bacterium]